MRGWIGFDLDGTLAHYDRWRGVDHIGGPVPRMVEKLRAHLNAGDHVKIFTARVAGNDPRVVPIIQDWLEHHDLPRLEVTNVKDFGMILLYDDRCVQVRPNTGITIEEELQ